MFNIKFLPQIEAFRDDLFGVGCVDTRTAAEEASRRGYVLPSSVQLIPCYETPEGEWVPVSEGLEAKSG